MKNVMLDLEFLGKPPAARIATIGACYFDPASGVIGDTFYRRVEWADDTQDLPMDPSTVEWWLKQSAEATTEIISDGREPLVAALQSFSKFIGRGGPHVEVWGNGSDCDCVILGEAYKSISIDTPWNFWATRDVRTIVSLVRSIHKVDVKKEVEFTGTPHHALHDAFHQAEYVSLAYQILNGTVLTTNN